MRPHHVTPTMGVARPIAGTYLTVDHCWRWTTWATLIIGGSCSVLSLFAIPESSAEVLLQKKACSLRKQTGNASFRAKREMQPVTADVLVTQLPDEAKAMLVREPTVSSARSTLLASYARTTDRFNTYSSSS